MSSTDLLNTRPEEDTPKQFHTQHKLSNLSSRTLVLGRNGLTKTSNHLPNNVVVTLLVIVAK